MYNNYQQWELGVLLRECVPFTTYVSLHLDCNCTLGAVHGVECGFSVMLPTFEAATARLTDKVVQLSLYSLLSYLFSTTASLVVVILKEFLKIRPSPDDRTMMIVENELVISFP